MKNWGKKKSWRVFMEKTPVLVVLGILVLLFAWNVLGFWNKMRETSKNEKNVEARVALLKEQKEKLLINIDNLNTDEGKEKVFRENFGLAKEGENTVVIVDDQNREEAPQSDTGWGFFSFFLNLFK